MKKRLSEKLVKYVNGAILLTNDCLARAIKEHGKEATRKYEIFLENSLCGSASAGHNLLKVYEKDAGISYEDIETQRLLKQGATLKERMVTRICDWAIGKWSAHTDELATDMQEAGQLLREACYEPDLELPRHTMRHLTHVLRTCPAKARLGVDLWVLRLFAALPIEGLKGCSP